MPRALEERGKSGTEGLKRGFVLYPTDRYIEVLMEGAQVPEIFAAALVRPLRFPQDDDSFELGRVSEEQRCFPGLRAAGIARVCVGRRIVPPVDSSRSGMRVRRIEPHPYALGLGRMDAVPLR